MALTLTTFNVKDLFDASPSNPVERVDAKVAFIAEQLARADADVVGLQEVGSIEVVAKIVARLPKGAEYGAPVIGTRDARGIRCALITRLPLVSSHVHVTDALEFPVFHAGDPAPYGSRLPLRRGVVHTELRDGSRTLHVLVAHFKSKRTVPRRDKLGAQEIAQCERARGEEEMRSVVWRGAEALHVRGIVDDLFAADPRAHLALLGDLNDVHESLTLRIVMGTDIAPLLSCADLVPSEKRFSTLHDGERTQIDHVLVSKALHERALSAEFLNDTLRDHGPIDDSAPPTVDSDHAPFVVRFA
jgi:endonuclease/exonuclease/phosphatase family metal-dependent hydrolase